MNEQRREDDELQQQQQQQQQQDDGEQGRRKRARSEERERESDDARPAIEEEKENTTQSLTHSLTRLTQAAHTAHTAHNTHTQPSVDLPCVEDDLLSVAEKENGEAHSDTHTHTNTHTDIHTVTHTYTHRDSDGGGGDNDVGAELRLCRCLLNVHGLYLDLLDRTTVSANTTHNNNNNNNNSDCDVDNSNPDTNASNTSNVINSTTSLANTTTTATTAAAGVTMSATHALSCVESLSRLIPLLEETLRRAKQRQALCERVISSTANNSVGNVAAAATEERASFAIQPVCGEALLALRAQPIKTATIATSPSAQVEPVKSFAQIVQDSLRSFNAKPFLDTASNVLANNGARSATEQTRDGEKENASLSPISKRQRPSPSASVSLTDNDNNSIVVMPSVPKGSAVAEEAFDELYLSQKGKYSFQFVTAADVFRDWYARELFRCGDGLADRIQRAYFSRVHRLVSYMKCFLPAGCVIEAKPHPAEEDGEKLRKWKEAIAEMAEELGLILEEFVFVHTKADTPAKRKALAESDHPEIEFKPFGTEPLSERRLKFPKITPFNTMIKVMPTIPGKLFPKSVVVDNNQSNFPQYLDFDAFHHR